MALHESRNNGNNGELWNGWDSESRSSFQVVFYCFQLFIGSFTPPPKKKHVKWLIPTLSSISSNLVEVICFASYRIYIYLYISFDLRNNAFPFPGILVKSKICVINPLQLSGTVARCRPGWKNCCGYRGGVGVMAGGHRLASERTQDVSTRFHDQMPVRHSKKNW